MILSMKHRKILFTILLMSCMLSACRTQQESVREIVRTDTVTIIKDSIQIRERIVPIEVPVPVIHIERVVPEDTTSVIDNGIFTSTASVHDGLLFHTLRTNPDAKISGSVQVADTTKTHDSSVFASADSVSTKTVIKEVNVLTSSQTFFIGLGKGSLFALILLILMFLIRFYLKKRGLLK